MWLIVVCSVSTQQNAISSAEETKYSTKSRLTAVFLALCTKLWQIFLLPLARGSALLPLQDKDIPLIVSTNTQLSIHKCDV